MNTKDAPEKVTLFCEAKVPVFWKEKSTEREIIFAYEYMDHAGNEDCILALSHIVVCALWLTAREIYL